MPCQMLPASIVVASLFSWRRSSSARAGVLASTVSSIPRWHVRADVVVLRPVPTQSAAFRALGQVQGAIAEEVHECSSLHPQAGAPQIGGRPARSSAQVPGPRFARCRRPANASTPRSQRDGGDRARPVQGVSEAGDDEAVRAADVVITMGCGDVCRSNGHALRGLALEGPAGKSWTRSGPIETRPDRRVVALLGRVTSVRTQAPERMTMDDAHVVRDAVHAVRRDRRDRNGGGVPAAV